MSTSRLAIYDDLNTPSLLEPKPPTRLEIELGRLRCQFGAYAGHLDAVSKTAVTRCVEAENTTLRVLSGVKDPSEPLSPGILYIGIAGLSATVFTRNRPVLLRILGPLITVGLTASYVLPQTTENVRAMMWSLENAYAPSLAAYHSAASHHSARAIEQLYGKTERMRQSLNQGVNSAGGLLQAKSGFKISDIQGNVKE